MGSMDSVMAPTMGSYYGLCCGYGLFHEVSYGLYGGLSCGLYYALYYGIYCGSIMASTISCIMGSTMAPLSMASTRGTVVGSIMWSLWPPLPLYGGLYHGL